MDCLKEASVAKSNAMIEASYRLTAQEQRILLAAISQIKKGEPVTDQVMYKITVHDISDLTGISPNSLYKELERAALSLKRREIRFPCEPNGKGKKPKVLVTSWLQTVQYAQNSGAIEFRFTHDILPYISQLTEQFTIYKLKDVAKLSSSHAIRLYELLIQWKSKGFREVELEWLRQAFLLSDKYPSIKDFKRWVLEPAATQINEHSNLWVNWEQKKTGRKVSHIIFKFGEKDNIPKKKSARKKPEKIDIYSDSFLSKHARPGETKDQAIRRLKEKYST